MKNNFGLYDSIKEMLAANKPQPKQTVTLHEDKLAAYAKQQPGSVIGGVDFGSIKESKEAELTEEELQVIADNITEEEYEQLDELSKKTLASYIKKASGTFDHERKVGRVSTSAEDARRYVVNPDNDPYYGSNRNKKVYDKKEKQLFNRRAGINKALDKLTKENLEEGIFSEEELQVIADNITEEEFEQLDELSKEKLGQYINRSLNDIRNANRAIGRRDKGKHIFGHLPNASAEDQEAHNANRAEAKKREAGVRLATKKLTKEDFEEGIFSEDEIAALLEMEQLDELSKETLKSYIGKNNLDPSRIKKRGPMPKDKAARLAKRDAGHVLANSKLAKIHKKETDAMFAKHAEIQHASSAHFMKSAHEHLTKKGYTFHGEHRHEGAVYSKYHPHNGVLNTFKVKRGSGGFMSRPSIVHTSIQGHSYYGHSEHHNDVGLGDTEVQHKDISNGVHNYIDKSEHDSHRDAENDHHWKDK